jgi:hypothetical protein
MKGSYKVIAITILVLCTGGMACKRAGEILPLPDYEPPTIKITTPAVQSFKNSTEPVNIVGTVVDNNTLKSLSIEVITADSLKRVQYFTHNVDGLKGYAFHNQYVMPLNNGGVPVKFIIAIAATDSMDNLATDSLLFTAY